MQFDKNFLIQLDKYPNKLIHARVTALNFQGQPLKNIEGHISQGTVNVDGASAVRRTCSLTLIADYGHFSQDEAQEFFNYSWGLHTRFKLEVGIENEIDSNYPEIIWFPQGVYITTSINVSYSTNNFQLTLQGKDKMCLLNGEVSGTIEHPTNFGVKGELGEDVKIPIEQIIRNAIHVYGKEPYHNIIIKDLEGYGFELMEYQGNTPLYLLRQGNDSYDEFFNLTYHGDTSCKIGEKSYTLATIESEGGGQYDIIGGVLSETKLNPAQVVINGQGPYTVVRLQCGNVAGYRKTELTYAGELIANVGESITSVLDKIVQMLGVFEYFYDLDGSFVFQKKPIEEMEFWGQSLDTKDKFINPITLSTDHYSFTSGELITAISNSPNISNIKNDFSIWGERESSSGEKLLIHMRYAIDNKPTQYTSIAVDDDEEEINIYNSKYNTNLKGQISKTYIAAEKYYIDEVSNTIYCDWREIIYQMANDYSKYNHLSDFLSRVALKNSDIYPQGITGYEQYYIDIQSFWRELYYPLAQLEKDKEDLIEKNKKNPSDDYEKQIADLDAQKENYFYSYDTEEGETISNNVFEFSLNGWTTSIVYYPELLNFWFDFLDLDKNAELNKYSVKSIGCRPKVLNDTTLHSLYYPTVPSIIYLQDLQEKELYFISTDYSYLQIPGNQQDIFSISLQGLSIKDKLNSLINEHTYYTESINLTTIPIYYLEPNTRISVLDDATGISGEYFINKIVIPLQYNGTMQITATKAVDNII